MRSGLGECGGDVGGCHLSEGSWVHMVRGGWVVHSLKRKIQEGLWLWPSLGVTSK